MKKVKLIIGSLFVTGIILFNLSLVANKTDVLSNFNLASLHQAFAYGLEEVTITCDGGGEGICYIGIDGPLVICGEYSDYSIICLATGDTNDYCEPSSPC